MINTGVVSIDDGGNSTCVVTKTTQEKYPSVKGVFGNRSLVETKGKYDYIVEYQDNKYVMGTLAKYDCSYPMQMHSESKQNLFYDLSILTSIHQFGYSNNFIVVSVPIYMYKDEEKQGRIRRLRGEHTITVNGITKKFVISDVKVAPETATAFWINEPRGKNRFLDIGSRTVGFATTLSDEDITRFIDTESGTFEGKGLEALDDKYDAKALADYICGKLLSMWSKGDKVNLLGGGALDSALVKTIKEYFPNTTVMENPQMATSLGMYELGKIAYNME